MKRIVLLISVIVMFLSGVDMKAQSVPASKKILVAYFSHSGNTGEMASRIKKLTGGDIFRIEPVKVYSQDYQTVVDQAKKEINAGYKPALKTKVPNLASYDVIFVGSPCWWGTIAPPVATFLADHTLTGKTIIPFMTHEGSRMGHTVTDIKKLCPGSTVLDGLPVRGSRVKDSESEIAKWLRDIKMMK